MPPNPHAGLVVIHGSGDSTRRNAWYLDIVDDLARRGIAIWFPDKRGTGASGGEWRDASFETLAQDAIAGRAALADAIAGLPIGYLGISQGGWIAPLAAQAEATPFVVSLSAAMVSPNVQLDHEVRADLHRNLPGFIVPLAFPVAAAAPRWRYPEFWRANGDFDPAAAIRTSGAPTFIAYGDQDELDNVPVSQSLDLIEAARAAGVDIEVMVVAGGGHDLSPGEGTGPTDPAVLDRIAAFVGAHSGVTGP
jgi:alpha-beta hydrolase superfamily lysophospholipase